MIDLLMELWAKDVAASSEINRRWANEVAKDDPVLLERLEQVIVLGEKQTLASLMRIYRRYEEGGLG